MKRNTRTQDSICWDCKNARAHLCAWIGRGEKIWDEADKQERASNISIKYYKGKKPTHTVYIVKRCKYFDPEGEKKGELRQR